MIDVFLQYDFLQNALLVGLMVGFLGPVLGVFILVRRLALITDALSHITLTGIAFHLYLSQSAGLLQTMNPLYMGMVFSAGGAVFMERLRNVYSSYKELAIPIAMSGGIGLGVVFISLADGFNNDLFNYLFGSVIAVTENDLITIAAVTVIVVFVLILLYKELLFLSFDEEQAKVSGLSARWINFVFIIMTALVIAASMRIVGILLVSSLMTLPSAAAVQLAKSFRQMFIYSVLFGEISILVGLVSAYHLNLAPGGMIVMTSLLILLLTIAVRKAAGRPLRIYRRNLEHSA
ncbi:metal ABC transporter permease [Alteribacillus sp. HJP-4]|uniref:metal ABC transporter permease n=1 Tax=Alteribacillus sp. HJP-4 TaxID=2775394 RepID=UPI0035CD1228